VTVYLDASAALKLVRSEPESDALEAWLQPARYFSAAEVLEVEIACALHRRGESAAARRQATALLRATELVPWSERIRDLACLPHDPPQRALDAIHLGTALALRERLEALVTYDRSLAAAAEAHGLPVVSPA